MYVCATTTVTREGERGCTSATAARFGRFARFDGILDPNSKFQGSAPRPEGSSPTIFELRLRELKERFYPDGRRWELLICLTVCRNHPRHVCRDLRFFAEIYTRARASLRYKYKRLRINFERRAYLPEIALKIFQFYLDKDKNENKNEGKFCGTLRVVSIVVAIDRSSSRIGNDGKKEYSD